MKELNKYILVAMNPKSTLNELDKNSLYAINEVHNIIFESCYYDDIDKVVNIAILASRIADMFKESLYDKSNKVHYSFFIVKYLDKFLKLSGEKIEEYLEDIDKINKEDKQ